MYKTILVPLDGSQRAEAILPHVEDLARRYEARVVFVRVLEPTIFTIAPEGMLIETTASLQALVDEARAYLADVKQRFERKGLRADTRFEQGAIIPAILTAASEENADLIAMSSHGRTGLTRAFYGSIAGGLLHRVDRPLLLIRAEEQES